MLVFILGCFCLMGAAGLSYVERGLNAAGVCLAAVGAIAVLWFFLAAFRKNALLVRITHQKKLVGAFLLFILFAGLVFEINYLGNMYNRRWDMTRQAQHTLDKGTLAVIQDLKEPVQITALYVGIAPVSLQDMLKEYEARSNGMISTEIVDPIENIGYASQFDTTITGKQRKLIVLSGKERRDIDFDRRMISEEEVTNAIIRVTRKERKAYFLTGHREYRIDDSANEGLSVFNQLLKNNNVQTQELLLTAQTQIPADCDVLVIAGPREFLSADEKMKIQQYLAKGGDALILIENTLVTTPDKTLTEEELRKNPDLNEILNQWGLRVYPDIVVDLSNHAGGDVGSPATRNYMPHKALTKGVDYTFYIRPRSISLLADRPQDLKVAPFVLTNSEAPHSWAESNRNLIVKFDEQDKPGPVPISYVIWRKNKGKSDTRMIVFSDADFLTNAFVSQYSNAMMGMNLINWLTEVDYQVFMEEGVKDVPKLELTSKQKRMVTVMLFAIPLLVALSGVAVWLQRRSGDD